MVSAIPAIWTSVRLSPNSAQAMTAVTALIAWALFGEELSAVQIAGMALATFGVALATARNPAPGTAA